MPAFFLPVIITSSLKGYNMSYEKENAIKRIEKRLRELEDMFYSAYLSLEHATYWKHKPEHYRECGFVLVDGEGWKVNPRFERAAEWLEKIKDFSEASYIPEDYVILWDDDEGTRLIVWNNAIIAKIITYFHKNFSMRASSDYNLK
jgi:hypothetical protein